MERAPPPANRRKLQLSDSVSEQAGEGVRSTHDSVAVKNFSTHFPLLETPYGIQHKTVATYRIAPMTETDFEKVSQQLEETVSKLKTTKDPEERKALLRAMRHLLVEADRLHVDRHS